MSVTVLCFQQHAICPSENITESQPTFIKHFYTEKDAGLGAATVSSLLP